MHHFESLFLLSMLNYSPSLQLERLLLITFVSVKLDPNAGESTHITWQLRKVVVVIVPQVGTSNEQLKVAFVFFLI